MLQRADDTGARGDLDQAVGQVGELLGRARAPGCPPPCIRLPPARSRSPISRCRSTMYTSSSVSGTRPSTRTPAQHRQRLALDGRPEVGAGPAAGLEVLDVADQDVGGVARQRRDDLDRRAGAASASASAGLGGVVEHARRRRPGAGCSTRSDSSGHAHGAVLPRAAGRPARGRRRRATDVDRGAAVGVESGEQAGDQTVRARGDPDDAPARTAADDVGDGRQARRRPAAAARGGPAGPGSTWRAGCAARAARPAAARAAGRGPGRPVSAGRAARTVASSGPVAAVTSTRTAVREQRGDRLADVGRVEVLEHDSGCGSASRRRPSGARRRGDAGRGVRPTAAASASASLRRPGGVLPSPMMRRTWVLALRVLSSDPADASRSTKTARSAASARWPAEDGPSVLDGPTSNTLRTSACPTPGGDGHPSYRACLDGMFHLATMRNRVVFERSPAAVGRHTVIQHQAVPVARSHGIRARSGIGTPERGRAVTVSPGGSVTTEAPDRVRRPARRAVRLTNGRSAAAGGGGSVAPAADARTPARSAAARRDGARPGARGSARTPARRRSRAEPPTRLQGRACRADGRAGESLASSLTAPAGRPRRPAPAPVPA